MKLVYSATSAETFTSLMRGHLQHMRESGFDVHALTSGSPQLSSLAESERFEVHCVDFVRNISPFKDLMSLARAGREIATVRPHIVNVGTPKASLLVLLASFALRVPVRIYTLRGLRLETTSGALRLLLWCMERLTSALATDIVAVSDSLRQIYLDQRLAKPSKVSVLGYGSSNGVDVDSHRPDSASRTQIRQELGIAPETFVIGFVGRLVRDKGIQDLYMAFQHALDTGTDATLLIVGRPEPGDPLPPELLSDLTRHDRIIAAGFIQHPARLYQALDVLVHPSYREGCPNAPIEAAATGVPCIGYDATGTRDVVLHGQTGLLIPSSDVAGLSAAIARYANDPALRRAHGEEARLWVARHFDREVVWSNLLDYYRKRFGLDDFSASSRSDQQLSR